MSLPPLSGHALLKKASVELLDTYHGINRRYDLNKRYESTLASHGFDLHRSPEIGHGTYSRILVSKDRRKVAKLQSPRKSAHPEDFARVAEREHQFNAHLSIVEKAPHVVKQTTAIEAPELGRYASIQENAGPNLYEIFLNRKNLQRKSASMYEIESIAKQLLEALAHLHTPHPEFGRKAPLIHFDVKPENAAMDDEGQAVLLDLGIAGRPSTEEKYSYFYRPPESVLGLPTSTSGDIWALGCVIFELATGGPLIPVQAKKRNPQTDADMFHAYKDRLDLQKLPDKLMKQQYPELFNENGQLKDRTCRKFSPYKQAIQKCWSPGEKIDLLIDLLDQILQLDPKKRKTAQELLQHSFFTKESLRKDTKFSLKLTGDREKFGVRICDSKGGVLLTPDPEFHKSCYHLPKLKTPYRLEFFDLSDPDHPIYSETRVIREGQTVEIHLDDLLSSQEVGQIEDRLARIDLQRESYLLK